MYFLDRFNDEMLFSLDLDVLDLTPSFQVMDIALTAPHMIARFPGQIAKIAETDSVGPIIQMAELLAEASLSEGEYIAPIAEVNAPPKDDGPFFADISGTPGDDNPLNGTAGDDNIDGLGGNDTIFGLSGDDVIDGGGGALAGTDTGTGSDTIDAGAGNDTIVYSRTTTSSSDIDSNDGGTGIDTFLVTSLDDFGGATSWAVDLQAGEFTLSGFGGTVRGTLTNIENVTYTGIADFDVRGDDGNNVIDLSGSDSDNLVEGLGGNDEIFTGDGVDTVNAGAGNDIIHDTESPVPDPDSYDGGAGIDTIIYGEGGGFTSSDITVNLATGFVTGSGMNFDSLTNIENVTIDGAANIIGDANNNVLTIDPTDGTFANTIDGGAGNDTINGGGGDDTIDGGDGNDRFIFDIADGTQYEGVFDGEAGTDAIVLRGTGTFNLNGPNPVDLDFFSIEEIEFEAFGGLGSRVLILDSLELDSAGEISPTVNIDGFDGGGVDTIQIMMNGTSLDISGWTFQDWRNLDSDLIEIHGDGSIETITGSSQVDIIDGAGGDDIINGGGGNDIIIGGLGGDTLDGGSGIDVLDYTASDAAVMIDLGANTASGGHASGDVISNFESVDGTAFNDTITSGFDFGTINGFGGDDVLSVTGGLNGSVLNGGDGNDILTSAVTMNSSALYGEAGDDELFLATDSGLPGTGDFGDGGSGNDLIILGIEIFNQFADGGTGIDTLSLAGLGGGYTIDMILEEVDDGDGLDNAIFANIENIIGSSGDDIIIGDGNDNLVSPGDGVDNVMLGGGNDYLTYDFANSGFDSGEIADGGAGNDTFDFAGYGFANVTIDLLAGTVIGGAPLGTVTNFENFNGSVSTGANGAIIRGTDGANILSAAPLGEQTLEGRGGDDVLTGGGDRDFLFGGNGDDMLDGGEGNDILQGGEGADSIDGGAGTDIADWLDSASGVTVNLGAGMALGGSANGDSFVNLESLGGSLFNDILTGDDNFNELYGYNGNDRLNGGLGDDNHYGGDGADTMIGNSGADYFDGGSGLDTADYRGSSSRVVVNLGTGGTMGDADGDTYISVERVYGTDFNDSITGTAANEFFFGEDGNDVINAGDGIDRLYGGAGNDIQRGDGGNDQLYGSAGADQLNGGTGFDIANYGDAASAVSLNLGSGGTLGDAAGDTYFGIEAVYGSDFNDILAGNNSANELRGGDGDDILNGGGGSDRLFGEAGADALNGGTGVDIAVYTIAASGVTVNLVTGGTVGDAAGDSYSSIEWVWGSDFNDIITGDAGNNRLEGRDGNDTLNGGAGNDRLLGGDGDDTINGGDGVDTIFGQNGNDNLIGAGGNDFFFGSAGGDSMNGGLDFDTVSYLASTSSVDLSLATGGFGGDAAGDSYSSIERVFGSQHNDFIEGSNGDNTLLGNGGNDYLEGLLGNDSLFGGFGIDNFGYSTTNGDADVINDFNTVTGEIIFIRGGDPAFDTFAEIMTVAADAGGNTIFNFGGGNTLTIIGSNIADLAADDFDFSVPQEPLDDGDVYATEPLTFDEIMAVHQAFAENSDDGFMADALI